MAEIMEKNNQISGGCLCGRIQFTIEKPCKPVSICHCKQCRNWCGSPLHATSVPLENLKFTNGENYISWFESSDFARRGFCRNCGSTMFWHADRHPEWSEDIAVMVGCLNEPTNLTVSEHIWCDFKGDYYEINDGIPQKSKE